MNNISQVKITSPSFLNRIGLPAHLFPGFLGLLLFMIGDGVESNYLSPFLVDNQGFSEGSAALTISLYGVFATIGSWFAGTLSAVLGPRKVMLIGAVIWVVFEAVFLSIGVQAEVHWVAVASYAIRGIGYPFFAYAFLVWISLATPAHQRGSSVGWFWFAFGAGLPTLGSLLASFSIPTIGELPTFWLGTALIIMGASVALFGIRDLRHAGPAALQGSAFSGFKSALTIVWHRPRVTAGAIVRLVNTTPNFALFVVAPFFFVHQVGFTQSEYLQIVTIVYTANIFANLAFGVVGDRLCWKRTVTWFGCVMSGVGILLLYYIPLWIGPNFLLTAICWGIFATGLAGFVPLTALVPAMVPTAERANALALYTLAAGLAAFLGPALVAVMGGAEHMELLIWIFAAMYLVGALLCAYLSSAEDPGR